MKRILFFIAFPVTALFASGVHSASQEDDFWLLLDESLPPLQNSLWLYSGVDDTDGNYYGISSNLALLDQLFFNFSATEQNYSVSTSEIRWGFNGSISPSFSWALQRAFWGKKDKLEKNDTIASLSFYHQRFSIQATLEAGDVELFLRGRARSIRQSVTTDHQAYELKVGYSWPQTYFFLAYKQHDYSRDISLLLRRPRLFRAANPVGIQQATALAESETSLQTGLFYHEINFELLLSQITSAVTQDSQFYSTVHVSKAISRQWTLGLDFELPLDEVPFSVGLNVGYMW